MEPPGTAYGSILIADRHAVRLNPSAFTCDAVEFERLAREKRFDEARALYVGDLLPGFYDDWILIERDRLAELHESFPEGPPGPTRIVEDAAPAAQADTTALLPFYLTSFFGRAAETQ